MYNEYFIVKIEAMRKFGRYAQLYDNRAALTETLFNETL